MDIYTGKRMRIEKNLVTFPGGRQKERIVVRPGGAVAMLPIDGEFCYLIRQYRYAIDAWIYEVPAGTMEEGEKPSETAARELIEEIGMAAASLVPQGFVYTTPGYTDERIYLYEARGLTPSSEYDKDDDEQIEVVKLKTADIPGMIEEGTIVDAKTICLAWRCLR